MAYVSKNPKSKADLKRRIADGEQFTVFQPGLGTVPENGTVSIEGPHFPKPHTWYGTATMKDGKIIKVV